MSFLNLFSKGEQVGSKDFGCGETSNQLSHGFDHPQHDCIS